MPLALSHDRIHAAHEIHASGCHKLHAQSVVIITRAAICSSGNDIQLTNTNRRAQSTGCPSKRESDPMRLYRANPIVLFLLVTLGLTASPGYADDIGDVGEARVQEVTSPLIGTKAPKLDIRLLNGDTIALGALANNKPVYLKFWATWCHPCRQQMPHLQKTFEKYGDDLQVLSVNAGMNDSVESVKAFQKEYGLTMPVAIDSDGQIGRAFKLTVTPQHVLIDRTGTIRYIGHLASDTLDTTLAALLQDNGSASPAASEGEKPRAEKAPKTLALLDGTSFDVDSAKDKPTVLFFFAAWCDWYLAETRPAVSARCIEFQERVLELHQRFGDEVRILGIAQFLWTDPDYLKEYQTRLGVTYPIGLDTDSAWFSAYGIRDVPAIVVLNAENEIESTISENADGLLEGISKLVAE